MRVTRCCGSRDPIIEALTCLRRPHALIDATIAYMESVCPNELPPRGRRKRRRCGFCGTAGGVGTLRGCTEPVSRLVTSGPPFIERAWYRPA